MRSTLSIVAASAAVAMLLPVASAEHGLVGACKAKNYTAVDIDVEKYVGRWYEMSRSKSFFFDNGCFCTQAAVSGARAPCAARGGRVRRPMRGVGSFSLRFRLHSTPPTRTAPSRW